MSTRKPNPGTAAELVVQEGIEALRGLALQDGDATIYVADREIDRLLAEEKEDIEENDFIFPAWKKLTYGGNTPDALLVRKINLNTVKPFRGLNGGE
ncbi:hypothetical protein IIE18_10675 [Pseudomonas sp. V1]|uniref:hypothetical protein n=1 Tax=Pseudomonas arcuscaelestis TaxID=2710591 RepID=UPI00193F07AF|nr:hypothetical protein [Pseudomonas arcuscaelestis]MBM3105604.1 hypothetical protein [Pseudomonas arcuscaelestis]